MIHQPIKIYHILLSSHLDIILKKHIHLATIIYLFHSIYHLAIFLYIFTYLNECTHQIHWPFNFSNSLHIHLHPSELVFLYLMEHYLPISLHTLNHLTIFERLYLIYSLLLDSKSRNIMCHLFAFRNEINIIQD